MNRFLREDNSTLDGSLSTRMKTTLLLKLILFALWLLCQNNGHLIFKTRKLVHKIVKDPHK